MTFWHCPAIATTTCGSAQKGVASTASPPQPCDSAHGATNRPIHTVSVTTMSGPCTRTVQARCGSEPTPAVWTASTLFRGSLLISGTILKSRAVSILTVSTQYTKTVPVTSGSEPLAELTGWTEGAARSLTFCVAGPATREWEARSTQCSRIAATGFCLSPEAIWLRSTGTPERQHFFGPKASPCTRTEWGTSGRSRSAISSKQIPPAEFAESPFLLTLARAHPRRCKSTSSTRILRDCCGSRPKPVCSVSIRDPKCFPALRPARVYQTTWSSAFSPTAP